MIDVIGNSLAERRLLTSRGSPPQSNALPQHYLP